MEYLPLSRKSLFKAKENVQTAHSTDHVHHRISKNDDLILTMSTTGREWLQSGETTTEAWHSYANLPLRNGNVIMVGYLQGQYFIVVLSSRPGVIELYCGTGRVV